MEIRASSSNRKRVASAALLVALAACSRQPTQLVVIVDSDLEVPATLSAVRAVVRDDAGAELLAHTFVLAAASGAGSGTALPISFGLAPPGDDDARRVTLDLEALDAASNVLFTRRTITGFVSGKSLVLPIFLSGQCRSLTCDGGLTCTELGCAAPEIDPGTLCEDGADRCAGPSGPATDAGARDALSPDAGDRLDATGPDVAPGDRVDPADVAPIDAADAGVEDLGIEDAEPEDALPVDAGGVPINVAPPELSGDPIEGQTLSASTGQWQSDSRITFAFQWQVCTRALVCTDLAGATRPSHVIERLQTDTLLRVVITASNDAGAATATSRESGPVRRATRVEAIYFAGFEAGDLAAYTADRAGVPLASAAVDTNAARSGDYGLRVATGPDGATSSWTRPIENASTVVLRFAFKLATLSAMQPALVAGVVGGQQDSGFVAYEPASMRLVASIASLPAPVRGPVISAGQWYLIDVRWSSAGGTAQLDWRVDGIPQPQAAAQGTLSAANAVLFGGGMLQPGDALDYDDLSIALGADDYPLGDAQIVALKPNACGQHTTRAGEFVDHRGVPIDQSDMLTWMWLDEWPPDLAMPDYVAASSFTGLSREHLAYRLEDPVAAPRAVRAYALVGPAQPNSPVAARVVLSDPSGTSLLLDGAIESRGGFGYFSAQRSTSANGQPWTLQAAADLELHIASSLTMPSTPRFDALMIEAELPR